MGVDLKALRSVREKWIQEYQPLLGVEGFLQVGNQLVQSGKYEEGFIAMGLIAHFTQDFTPQIFEYLGHWLEIGLCNWAHVDSFSSDILPIFLIKYIVPLSAFSNWRKSESKWKRRAVPVTLIKMLKDGQSIPELLAFVEPMMADQEKVVQQGWVVPARGMEDIPNSGRGFSIKVEGPLRKLIIHMRQKR